MFPESLTVFLTCHNFLSSLACNTCREQDNKALCMLCYLALCTYCGPMMSEKIMMRKNITILNFSFTNLTIFFVCLTFFQVIPNYSSKDQYDKMFALGVTMYGQMTAGSYCYIGPQGIVHGTTVSRVVLTMPAN